MSTVDTFLIIFLILFITLTPFIIALFTNHKKKGLILFLGILTGWTFIGLIALCLYALKGSRFLPTKEQLNEMKNKTGESDETKLWWFNLPKWTRILVIIMLMAILLNFIFQIIPYIDQWWDKFYYDNFWTLLGIFLLLPFIAAFLYIFDFIFNIKK